MLYPVLVGSVGWLEIGLILALAFVPVALTVIVAVVARLSDAGQDDAGD